MAGIRAKSPRKIVKANPFLDKEENSAEDSSFADAIKQALNETDLPDLRAVLGSFFKHAGGAEAFGKSMAASFKKAKPGTMIKARITELILHATKAMAAKEESRDANLLSDDDLEDELVKMFVKVKRAGLFGSLHESPIDITAIAGEPTDESADAGDNPEAEGGAPAEAEVATGCSGGPEAAVDGEGQAEDRGVEAVQADAVPEGIPGLDGEGTHS